jgi:hypothetical protein
MNSAITETERETDSTRMDDILPSHTVLEGKADQDMPADISKREGEDTEKMKEDKRPRPLDPVFLRISKMAAQTLIMSMGACLVFAYFLSWRVSPEHAVNAQGASGFSAVLLRFLILYQLDMGLSLADEYTEWLRAMLAVSIGVSLLCTGLFKDEGAWWSILERLWTGGALICCGCILPKAFGCLWSMAGRRKGLTTRMVYLTGYFVTALQCYRIVQQDTELCTTVSSYLGEHFPERWVLTKPAR